MLVPSTLIPDLVHHRYIATVLVCARALAKAHTTSQARAAKRRCYRYWRYYPTARTQFQPHHRTASSMTYTAAWELPVGSSCACSCALLHWRVGSHQLGGLLLDLGGLPTQLPQQSTLPLEAQE